MYKELITVSKHKDDKNPGMVYVVKNKEGETIARFFESYATGFYVEKLELIPPQELQGICEEFPLYEKIIMKKYEEVIWDEEQNL